MWQLHLTKRSLSHQLPLSRVSGWLRQVAHRQRIPLLKFTGIHLSMFLRMYGAIERLYHIPRCTQHGPGTGECLFMKGQFDTAILW